MEGRYLHGAACHGCVLIGETSCEARNDHLDRALVVPILGVTGMIMALFQAEWLTKGLGISLGEPWIWVAAAILGLAVVDHLASWVAILPFGPVETAVTFHFAFNLAVGLLFLVAGLGAGMLSGAGGRNRQNGRRSQDRCKHLTVRTNLNLAPLNHTVTISLRFSAAHAPSPTFACMGIRLHAFITPRIAP